MKPKFDARSIVLLGLLMAIVLIFSMTPYGSIPIGPLSITLNVIPIGIAAVALGPWGGLIIGTFFGVFSFLQCFGIGVPSGMGAILVDISPVAAFVQRVVPRALDGFLVGLIHTGVTKLKNQKAYYVITGIVAALFGTAMFLSIMQLVGYDPDGESKMTPALYSLMHSGSLLIYISVIVALLCFIIGYMLVNSKMLSREHVSCALTGFCSAIFNTIFFMTALIVLFGNTDYVKGLREDKVGDGNWILFVIVFVGVNALFEMAVSTVVTGAVGSALYKAKLIKMPDVKAAEDAAKAEKAAKRAAKKEKKKKDNTTDTESAE